MSKHIMKVVQYTTISGSTINEEDHKHIAFFNEELGDLLNKGLISEIVLIDPITERQIDVSIGGNK